jgi:pectate lyase
MSRRRSVMRYRVLASLAVVAVAGCSASDSPKSDAAGLGGTSGTSTSGGAGPTAGGSDSASGGGAATGAQPASGGSSVGTGGKTSSGGTSPPSGGASGGAEPASGGTEPSTGGAPDTGGSGPSTGGVQETGGRSGSGGRSNFGGRSSAAGTGTGGATATGGTSSTGGVPPTGGRSSTGGAAPSGGATSTGGSSGDDSSIPTQIPTPSNGSGEIRSSTTVLKNAQNGGQDVWDFNNQKIGVNNSSDCDNGEDQVTVFEVEDGVTVKNLIVAGGLHAGNGIVCKGNCTLDHVYWEDVCEDAATNSKDGATMTIDHSIALHASDKVFQHNAKGGSKTVVKNSYVSDFGKLWRSCGDCTSNGGPRHLILDNVRVEGVNVAVAGANQNYGDTATITNLYVKGGYNAGSDRPRICTEYMAVTDHNGESTSLNGGASQWNTATCKVSQSDVKSW